MAVASNAASEPMSGLHTAEEWQAGSCSKPCSPGIASMLRTLLILSFLALAVIAPVWIPVPAAKALAPRPSATRLEEDD
jgi:hypothetical protein